MPEHSIYYLRNKSHSYSFDKQPYNFFMRWFTKEKEYINHGHYHTSGCYYEKKLSIVEGRALYKYLVSEGYDKDIVRYE
jgi:hypothetical protein